jgi:predicted alpha/beta-hydrolase family hydrolase
MAMQDETVSIQLPDGRAVSGVWNTAADSRWTLVYAPGAGSDLRDGFGQHAARALPSQGISVLRFQFPYSEAGRRLPDRPPVLEATWTAAIATARERTERLVIGGRSMGGRIASQVAAGGVQVGALALFAYPLHPPGQAERRRDEHFPRIAVPTLFCSGTKDAFATPDELRAAAVCVPNAIVHVLDGADHSFAVAKRTGRAQPQVWEEAIGAFLHWIGSVS